MSELYCGLAYEGRAEAPEAYLDGKLLYVEPGTTIGPRGHKFEIIAKLGHGGSSVVWMARKKNTRLGGWRAIKIIAAGRSSVDEEIAAVQRIESCGVDVVGCKSKSDAWTEERDSKKYLCLKMGLSGPSVKECLECDLAPELRLSLAIQATDIMSKLHKGNMFLYDFSSSNLLAKLKPEVDDELMWCIIEETMRSEKVVIKVDQKGTSLSKDPKFPKILYAPISLGDIVDEMLPLQLIDVNQDPSNPGCSPPYAPPEFLEKIHRGDRSIIPDAKSNIFTLGVLVSDINSAMHTTHD
ncbi:hypothetical protein CJF31_00007602 [Rutstroemia sp. NJR-2017a BVV2]|nr:hypothetical protein CJF31_00007602 [Rutstroemia sp. NJR-2017a BVV2]